MALPQNGLLRWSPPKPKLLIYHKWRDQILDCPSAPRGQREVGLRPAWPNTHRSMESFCANSRQSLPRELGASRLLHIFWRMDSGILKA